MSEGFLGTTTERSRTTGLRSISVLGPLPLGLSQKQTLGREGGDRRSRDLSVNKKGLFKEEGLKSLARTVSVSPFSHFDYHIVTSSASVLVSEPHRNDANGVEPVLPVHSQECKRVSGSRPRRDRSRLVNVCGEGP